MGVLGCERDAGPVEPAASSDASATTATADEPKVASVAEVAALVTGKKVTPVDANGPEVREKQGVVPGAILLSKPPHIGQDLPADKAEPLVFYCYNKW